MRFLPSTMLCAIVILSACAKKESERRAAAADTGAAATPAAAPSGASASSTSETPGAASKLLGTWTAVGYDSGSARASRFTVVYRQAAGGVTGTVTFAGSGPKYNVKVVAISDSGFVQESDPHQSPTLKKEVVTRTEARFAGD